MSMSRTSAFPFSLKTVTETGEFEGYGSVFGVVDSYGDRVMPGAFSSSIERAKTSGRHPALLWQHDRRQPIGVYAEMAEDEKGLRVKGRLLKDEVKQAAEAYALLKAGAISGLSIGYRTVREQANPKMSCFDLLEVDLWEVSLVTFPANDEARIENVKSDIREFEKFLRDAGLSRREAKAVASCGFEGFRRRDAETDEILNLAKARWTFTQ